jgi:hypothetical protein
MAAGKRDILWWLFSIEVLWALEGLSIGDSSIGDNSINASAHAQFACGAEEIDLRLPIGDIAVQIMVVVVARGLAHLIDERSSPFAVDVAHNNVGPAVRPFPEKTFSEA